MNNLLWFEGASIGFAVLLWLLGTHVLPDAERSPEKTGTWRGEMAFRVFLVAGMFICGALSFYILWTHSPSNWDSSGYRFPRAIWSLQHGNLLHFAKPYNDPRALYYPFNGTIIYIFLAIYQFWELAFTGVTLIAWCLCGLGAYTTSRRLGSSLTGSLLAAFLGVLTPAVLCQAAATNDEVLAASAILLGLPFAVDWVKTPKRRFGLLAGMAFGLGVGTKLHWAFYYPYLILAGVFACIWVARNLDVVRAQLRIRVIGVVVAVIPILVFGVNFAVANWLSAGVWTNSTMNDSVLNKPFNIKVAEEKLYAGTGQLFLAPIPDVLRHGSQADVVKQYEAFNSSMDKALFSGVTEIRKVSIEGYQFKGPLSDGAASYLMNEYTVFAGMLPWLVTAAVLLAAFRKDVNKPALWIAGSLLGWHFCYILYMKYIPGASAYYTYPAAIAAAGMGPLWDWAIARKGIRPRILVAVFALTAISHSIVASHIFHYNTLRNVVFGWTKDPATDMHTVGPALKQAIQMADRIHIPHMSWSQLMWQLMRHNLSAAYSTGDPRVEAPLNELQLIGLSPGTLKDRAAVILPRAASSSAIFLGHAFGQRYYGTGAVAMGLHPEQVKMSLVSVSFPKVPKGTAVAILGPWIGVKASDGLHYRVSLSSSATQRIFPGEWRSTAVELSGLEVKEPDVIDEVLIDMRHPSKPKEYVRTYLPITALSAVMPARAELMSDEPSGVTVEAEIVPLESAAAVPKGPSNAMPKGARGSKALAVKMINAPAAQVGTSNEKIDYVIRWIPKSSVYEFENTGAPRKAEFALFAGKVARNRTLRLKVNGTLIGTEGSLTKVLWVNGMDEIRFPINLEKGVNRFELSTPEDVDVLSGEKLCCMLVGTPVVIVR